MRNNSIFRTCDFSLSVYILAKEIPLIGLEPTSTPRKFTFVFKKTNNLHNLIKGFWDGTGKIEPLKLFIAERELKKRLYSDSYIPARSRKEKHEE
jgi:hypothetical protein